MSRFRIVSTAAGMIAVAGLFTWLTAAEHDGAAPANFPASSSPLSSGPTDDRLRDAALRRAEVYLDPADAPPQREDDPLNREMISCRFTPEEPSGTSPKFSCEMEDGEQIKVKYGRNPEIQAEAAGTHLLRLMGFAADEVVIAPKVRCYGCPRYPFLTMRLLSLASVTRLLGGPPYDEGYTDFEWAGVERKFPAPTIETETVEGWNWWELPTSTAPRADIDALRLAAVFLAHWDNKSSNQRLVCLDGTAGACTRPLLMIQDLGATFGPEKVNLARWRDLPVWEDRDTCTISMTALPYEGATFGTMKISEEGRLYLASRLAAMDDSQIRALFSRARFPEFYSGTDDTRDLEAWTAAFKARVDQITAGPPCPAISSTAASPSRPSRGSSSAP